MASPEAASELDLEEHPQKELIGDLQESRRVYDACDAKREQAPKRFHRSYACFTGDEEVARRREDSKAAHLEISPLGGQECDLRPATPGA